MTKIKNAVTARFSNIELNPFKDNEILSLEVNEGISIPFRAKLKFCSKEKLTKDKLKALLSSDLKITLKQTNAEGTTTRDRIFKGIVVSFQDLGIYQQITENSQKIFIYAYELTLMPEIVKLGYKKHNRSFENKNLDEVLETVFKDENLVVDTAKENHDSQLWVDKPLIDDLVLSQAQESDLEFVNGIIRTFGLNFNVIYDRERGNNKYVFSRGWFVDTGAKVYESKANFQGNDLGQDISSAVIEANYFDGNDSFEEHFIYDLKSDGVADFFESLNESEDSEITSICDSYLSLGNLSYKRKNEIRSYFENSYYCLKKSLSEKVLVKVSDLVYTPGSKFSLKAYSENEKFMIVREVLNVKVKNTDYNNPEYELTQTCLGLLVKQNDEKRKLLGSVVDLARINLESSLSDCSLVSFDNKKGTAVALSQSNVSNVLQEPNFNFVIGTVCDKESRTANYSVYIDDKKEKTETVFIENTIAPASIGKSSIPNKFYLKIKNSESTEANAPVVVEYLSRTFGNASNYFASFPRIGQRVLAIKANNSYLFYAYLPQEDDIDVFDDSMQKANMSGVSLIDYKDTIENFSDYDIGLKGLDFKHFESLKDRFCYLILNDDVDNFMYGASLRRNDLSIYEDFNDKGSTIKQSYPSISEVQIATKCLSLPDELKKARNAYRAAVKDDKEVDSRKSELNAVYADLKAVAAKLIEIFDKNSSKDSNNRAEDKFSKIQSSLVSDGDLKIATKNDLEIDAKNLTLRVKGNINISADGAINLISEKKISLNSGCASIEVAPRSINSKVRRVWKCDLPYDSSMKVTNTGVSMTGLSANVSSLLTASVKDGFGGKLSLSHGEATVSGTPVTVTTPKKLSVIFNFASLLKNITESLNIATTLSNKKGAKISVAAIQNTASSALTIVQDVFNRIDEKKQYDKQEIDPISYACSWIVDSVDMAQAGYELVEAIVLASLDENGDAKKKYTARNRGNYYMSPQDCVKNSMFYLKGIAAMVPAVAAKIAIIRDGKKSTIKVLSNKIKFNTGEFDNQSLTSSVKNSAVNGAALPSQPPVGGAQPNQSAQQIGSNQQVANAQAGGNQANPGGQGGNP